MIKHEIEYRAENVPILVTLAVEFFAALQESLVYLQSLYLIGDFLSQTQVAIFDLP